MIIDEERKFRIYEKIRLRGLYNMLDYKKVLAYAWRYFKLDISKEEYVFLLEHYPELKEKYLK